jgi:hypothetical protein
MHNISWKNFYFEQIVKHQEKKQSSITKKAAATGTKTKAGETFEKHNFLSLDQCPFLITENIHQPS